MKRVVLAALAALVVAIGLLVVTSPSAQATPATPQLKRLAKKMGCKFGSPDALSSDAAVTAGWNCVVGAGTRNRREYYLMTYRNTSRAIDEWRDWTSCYDYDEDDPCEPGYIAAKGRVLIVAQNSRDSYGYQFANYAARRTGGRVIGGYRY